MKVNLIMMMMMIMSSGLSVRGLIKSSSLSGKEGTVRGPILQKRKLRLSVV